MNNEIAEKIKGMLVERLRIPEDVAVFGFDCVDICTMMNPPLPVVHQPEEEIGRIAANFLIDRLNGFSGEPRHMRLKCHIMEQSGNHSV